MKYTECYDCGATCKDTGKMSRCKDCQTEYNKSHPENNKKHKPGCICHLVGRDFCMAHEDK